MKNILIWIGVAFIIAATIVGQFTGIEVATWVELAGFAIGTAACIVGIFRKAEKKDWKLYVSIIGIILGAGLLTFAGVSKDVVISLITMVVGIVALIAGLLPTILKKKKV